MPKKSLIGAIPFLLIIITLALYWSKPELSWGQQTSSVPLSGYAWSSDVGWISVSSGNTVGGINSIHYGVYLQPLDGSSSRSLGGLAVGSSGFAWSSNIGWIKFSPDINSLLATGELAPPPEPGGSRYPNDRWGARLELTGTKAGYFTGWARACAVFDPDSDCGGVSSVLRPSSDLGGWNGWIKFNGDGYTTRVDDVDNPTHFTDDSYAWGAAVLGKISFCDPDHPTPYYCVRFSNFRAECSVEPNNRTYPLNSGPYDFIWRTDTTGGSADDDYVYVWSGDISHNSGPTSETSYEYVSSEACGSTDITRTGQMQVTNGTDTATCPPTLLNVICADDPLTPPVLDASAADVVKISIQPRASPAISSQAKFSHDSEVGTIDISIASMNSLVNNTINIITDPKVKCRLQNTPVASNPQPADFDSCDDSSIQLSNMVGNRDAYFNVLVDNPAPDGLNPNSPYQVLFDVRACAEDGTTCNDDTKAVKLEYNVGTPTPI